MVIFIFIGAIVVYLQNNASNTAGLHSRKKTPSEISLTFTPRDHWLPRLWGFHGEEDRAHVAWRAKSEARSPTDEE